MRALDSKARARLRKLPPVRRARAYYLYDGTGKRYLDLWQEGGRAWLGHRPEGMSLHLKNAASRGVYAALPSAEEGKLLKALKALGKELGAEDYSEVRWFSSGPLKGISTAAEADIPLWRPGENWGDSKKASNEVELLLPLPGLDYGRVFLCRKSSPVCTKESPVPSPVTAAALIRVVWSLIAALKNLPEYEDFASSLWEQKGAYLFWKGNSADYDAIFSRALEKRVLLPPSTEQPVILPREQSEGDRTLIRTLFRRKP